MQHKEAVKVPVKEDITIKTPKLGPVGGRIVAEVFLGLMFGDTHSCFGSIRSGSRKAHLRPEGLRQLRARQMRMS